MKKRSELVPAESPLAESGKASNHHSILPIVIRNIEMKARLKLLK